MKTFNLQFLQNEADEDEGLGHAGIETYKGDPYASTARECGQNSSDAGCDLPVVINFDLLDIPIIDIPVHDKLILTINKCFDKSKFNKKEKDIDFFSHAQRLLARNKVKILRIADYNTKGLRGPCIPGTPFHSLVKGTGVSNKEQDSSGGSFGIGKNAVFAISDLQTVFYSTYYIEKESIKFLAQGKSLFISHYNENKSPVRATGYWGDENFKPVENEFHAPYWLRRKEQGTSIFAVGFREVPNWQYRMAGSLIINFFVAIHRKEMSFHLNDNEIIIDAKTLPQLFENEKILKALDESSKLEDFKYAINLYDCLTSEESLTRTINIKDYLKVKVKILIKEELPKRLSIIRNGMIITDSLENFGERFKSFPMYRDFVAFVEPLDESSSVIIKNLENPSHDGLSAERISNEEKRKFTYQNMKELAKEIRSVVREETISVPEKVQALDELSEFFADDNEVNKIPDPESGDDIENYTYEAKTKNSNFQSYTLNGEDEGGGAGKSNNTDGGNQSGTGPNLGASKGGHNIKPVELADIRNIITDKNDANNRTIWFTPKEGGSLKLTLFATGINSNEKLAIQESPKGKIIDGSLNLDVIANDRYQVSIRLVESYTGPIELSAIVYK